MHTIFDTAGTQYAVARKRLDDRSVVFTVHAGEALVARAVLDSSRGSISEVLMWPAWRRRGIATALYRLIEWERGEGLRPSRIRSRLSKAFWTSRH
jgi:GNAT superfamily N-acetyltransferase